ncbi:MAG TPA: dipeptide epimerase [Planctomycetota bacterium]|nr:dipeptide epimerase [Planctomycetota bacterium]HRU50667.1 dipeptide epimerase [Planctomycetota bacterium]
MQIKKIVLQRQNIPLNKVFRTALRETKVVSEILVTLETDTGHKGHGSACSCVAITGETLASIEEAILTKIYPAIVDMDLEYPNRIFHAIQTSIAHNPVAKAAVDIAVYDLWSQQVQRPLHKLLGGFHTTLQTDLTLSLDSIDKMVHEAHNAVQQGFTILKLKVGDTPELDIQRVQEIRKAIGDSIQLRLDANQAWTPREAVQILRKLSLCNIELVEQPVIAYDFSGLAYVKNNTDIPIMADESIFNVQDALRLVAHQTVDYLNIKLLKCGGISQALKIAHIAESYNIPCMMGCMMEGPTSLAAAIQFAASQRIITKYDLDCPLFWENTQTMQNIVCHGPNIEIVQ